MNKRSQFFDIPVFLGCGCRLIWHEGEILCLGAYAWCQEHGDTNVEKIVSPSFLDALYEDQGVVRLCLSEDGAQRIANGESFAEVAADELCLPSHDDLRWDGPDIEAVRRLPDGAREVVAVIEVPRV